MIPPRSLVTSSGMGADYLLCSRNARPQKALVGRAQWKINQPPSLRESEQAWRDLFEHERWSLNARSEGRFACPLW